MLTTTKLKQIKLKSGCRFNFKTFFKPVRFPQPERFKKIPIFFILLAIFSLSLLLRFNQLSPVVKSHEQTYILTLQTSEIWRTEGLLNCHLTPMWTYNNQGDKHIAYYKRLEDSKGNNYYVSFPPLSFIVAHLALLPFNLAQGKLVLQIINLLLHLLSAYILYLIICGIYNQNPRKFYLPAIMGFIAYSFMPVMLYFHTDIFFPEMIGQVLWVVSLYTILLIIKGVLRKPHLTLFSVLFLFLFAEWIAVFFVFSLCLYHAFSKDKSFSFILKTSLLALLSAGLIMLIQYASIAGIADLSRAMGLRFLERSGFFGQKYSSMGVHIFSANSLGLLGLNLHKALNGFGYFILLIFVVLFLVKKINLSSNARLMLLLSALPMILHFIIFFNANAIHLLLMARTSLPISILTGVITYSLMNNFKNSIYLKTFCCFILVLTVYSAFIYKNKFTFPEKFPFLNKAALTIKDKAKPNQSVFIKCNTSIPEPEKYLTYISKRNIVRVADIKEAQLYLNNKTIQCEFILFHINSNECSFEIIQHYH